MKSLLQAFAVVALTMAGWSVSASAQNDMHRDLRAKFEAKIKKINDDFPGAFAAVFVDLADGQKVTINPDVVMSTASTIKVSILMELFRQSEQKPGLLQQLRPFKANEATGRGGIALVIGENSSLTLEDIARIMINFSDNTATNIMIDEVGMDNVNKTIAAMGLKTMKLQRKMLDTASQAAGRENISSAADGASLMTRIATCDLPVSKASCARIRQIMEIPQMNASGRNPTSVHAALEPIPRNIPVAFKWGGLEGVSNGWGIVNLPDRPYIFIIMTSFGPAEPAQTLIDASAAAFEYYSALARANAYGSRVGADVMRRERAQAVPPKPESAKP